MANVGCLLLASKKTRNLAIAAAIGSVGVAGVAGYLLWQRYSFGDVKMATIPSGVPVTIDGAAIGPGPAIGRLSVGQHAVSVPASFTDLMNRTWTFLQWENGATLPTRNIDVLSTAPGDTITNLFLATYSTGSNGGQILAAVTVSPTILQNTQYFSAGAVITQVFQNPLGGCSYQTGAYGQWTKSDFVTPLAGTIPRNALDLIFSNDNTPMTIMITAVDTVGKPIPNVAIEIWTDPTKLAPNGLDGFNLLQLISTDQNDALGTATSPIQRVTDQNGNAVVNMTPAIFGNGVTLPAIPLIACSDQVSGGSLPNQSDLDAHFLCAVHVGDGVAIGSGCANCGGCFPAGQTGFCCTRNGNPLTSPTQGLALATIHARAVGTLREGQISYSQTVQVRLA